MHREDFDPKREERINSRGESDWMNVYLKSLFIKEDMQKLFFPKKKEKIRKNMRSAF
jgi:hypothetical protein